MSETESDSDSDCQVIEDILAPRKEASRSSAMSTLDPSVQMELNAMMGHSEPSFAPRSSAVMSRLGGITKNPSSAESRGSPGRVPPAAMPKLAAPKPKSIDQVAKYELESLMRKPALSSEEK